jgi:hypothetical protein
MAQLATMVRRRVDFGSTAAVVAVGDILAIALWVAVGEVSHGLPPWEYPLRMVTTMIPFLIGWAVAAFVGGLYTEDAWKFPIRAVSWTAPAWIVAVLIAQALRATPIFPGNAALTFALVSTGVGLAVLLPWRALVAYWTTAE